LEKQEVVMGILDKLLGKKNNNQGNNFNNNNSGYNNPGYNSYGTNNPGSNNSGYNSPQKETYSRHTTFRITEQGRDKLQDFTGDDKSNILVSLETNGSCTMDEIADKSRVARGRVERLIPVLVKNGFIQPTGAAVTSD
jgi:hypothetical protein